MIGDEDTDDEGAPTAPLKGKRHHQCSYCSRPGHKANTCPEKRAAVRAERRLQVEERVKSFAASGRLTLVPGDVGALPGAADPDVGEPGESEATDVEPAEADELADVAAA